MLQQTQTERVLPKYREFLKRFPNWKKLASAPLAEVLGAWLGLGYNRRARFLHEAAKIIVRDYKGHLPDDLENLRALPGVGEYTANAIVAFAFDKTAICLETNIRSVFTHFFFKDKKKVHDTEIKILVSTTLPVTNYREWYYALMDYGVFLKKTCAELNLKNAHYSRQAPFKGSRREVRGAILSQLISNKIISIKALAVAFRKSPQEIISIVDSLVQDKLVKRVGKRLVLP